MKLYYSDASPYARKVRIVAAEKNIPLELEFVSAFEDPKQLHAANPIGKVPTLQIDADLALGESMQICQYLESLTAEPKLHSVDVGVLRRDAFAIGLMDALIRIILESRRPQEVQHQPWVDRQFHAIERTLDVLETETFGKDFTIDQITLVCALCYMEFRLPDFNWRSNHPKLAEWLQKVSERKSVKDTIPR